MDNMEKLIPDFEELEKIAEEASRMKARAIAMKHRLSQLESSYIREALTDEEYWPKNKPPSMSYCNSVVSNIGNTDEQREKLMELRRAVTDAEERYHYLSKLIDVRRDQLDLYRTMSANERKGFL